MFLIESQSTGILFVDVDKGKTALFCKFNKPASYATTMK